MELDGSVKKELALARWCDKKGMHDRALFHYVRLLHNPAVDAGTVKEAVKKLDLVVYGGQLCPRCEAIELEQAIALDQAAWIKWERKFVEWQKAFEGGKGAKQQYALDQLLAVDDFHVTPLIESYLPSASEGWTMNLLPLLAKFPQPVTTETLAHFAVLSPHDTGRELAILPTRRPRDSSAA